MLSDEPKSLINLRAFPGRTQATFYLIVIVFLGTVLAGLDSSSPVCLTPLVLAMLILPVRAILAKPGEELAHQDLAVTQKLQKSGTFQKIQATITSLAAAADYHEPIKLVISHKPLEMRAFGSWRRHYIWLGSDIAERIALDLDSPIHKDKARALLLHEIAHLINRDVQQIGYTGHLLRSCLFILPWWIALAVGLLSVVALAGRSFLSFDIAATSNLDPVLVQLLAPTMEFSPEQRAEMMAKTQTASLNLAFAFTINALLPIIFIAFVLWLFFWRRMVRWQEFQADYLVATVEQSHTGLLEAMQHYKIPPHSSSSSSLEGKYSFIPNLWHNLVAQPFSFLASFPALNRLTRWFALHPTYEERVTSLKNPNLLLENWNSVAWPIAVFILSLDVMLATPLTFYHLGDYPIHFSTIAIFSLLATWMLPFIVLKKPFKYDLAKILVVVLGVRWGWLILNFGLLLFTILVYCCLR